MKICPVCNKLRNKDWFQPILYNKKAGDFNTYPSAESILVCKSCHEDLFNNDLVKYFLINDSNKMNYQDLIRYCRRNIIESTLTSKYY